MAKRRTNETRRAMIEAIQETIRYAKELKIEGRETMAFITGYIEREEPEISALFAELLKVNRGIGR